VCINSSSWQTNRVHQKETEKKKISVEVDRMSVAGAVTRAEGREKKGCVDGEKKKSVKKKEGFENSFVTSLSKEES